MESFQDFRRRRWPGMTRFSVSAASKVDALRARCPFDHLLQLVGVSWTGRAGSAGILPALPLQRVRRFIGSANGKAGRMPALPELQRIAHTSFDPGPQEATAASIAALAAGPSEAKAVVPMALQSFRCHPLTLSPPRLETRGWRVRGNSPLNSRKNRKQSSLLRRVLRVATAGSL